MLYLYHLVHLYHKEDHLDYRLFQRHQLLHHHLMYLIDYSFLGHLHHHYYQIRKRLNFLVELIELQYPLHLMKDNLLIHLHLIHLNYLGEHH
jgi:hypothetical protein